MNSGTCWFSIKTRVSPSKMFVRHKSLEITAGAVTQDCKCHLHGRHPRKQLLKKSVKCG